MAEKVGFEPTVMLPPRLISSQPAYAYKPSIDATSSSYTILVCSYWVVLLGENDEKSKSLFKS